MSDRLPSVEDQGPREPKNPPIAKTRTRDIRGGRASQRKRRLAKIRICRSLESNPGLYADALFVPFIRPDGTSRSYRILAPETAPYSDADRAASLCVSPSISPQPSKPPPGVPQGKAKAKGKTKASVGPPPAKANASFQGGRGCNISSDAQYRAGLGADRRGDCGGFRTRSGVQLFGLSSGRSAGVHQRTISSYTGFARWTSTTCSTCHGKELTSAGRVRIRSCFTT